MIRIMRAIKLLKRQTELAFCFILSVLIQPVNAQHQHQKLVGSRIAIPTRAKRRTQPVDDLRCQGPGLAFTRRFDSREDFMRVAATGAKPHYPGFSEDPLDGFRRLANDLRDFGNAFLVGTDEAFAAILSRATETAPPKGFARLNQVRG